MMLTRVCDRVSKNLFSIQKNPGLFLTTPSNKLKQNNSQNIFLFTSEHHHPPTKAVRQCKMLSAGTKVMMKRMVGNNYKLFQTRGVRVLATDGVDDICVKIFKERGHTVDFLKTLPEAELVKIIGDYEGLVVRSATKVNANVLKHATKMRLVGRAGVGVDNIDVAEATKRGVMVMNTPGGNTVSTAQLAVSLLANLARQLPAADMSIKAGKWDRKSFMGVEINGKVLGIVGCGRIGQVVAGTATTMGMQVIGYDPVMTR